MHKAITLVIREVIEQLQSMSARLEAEILLAEVLGKPRSFLHTYPERLLTDTQMHQLTAWVQRRQRGEPVAYIIGHQDFWNIRLMVTADTLIPRPETELLVEWVLQKLAADQPMCIADLGTGSGAIALAIAKERPHWRIYATDQSAAALQVASTNAEALGVTNVRFLQGSWCEPLPQCGFHAILSNPPYIANADPHLLQGDVRFEPRSALVAGEDGLQAIRLIMTQAKHYLLADGWLMLEHGYDQGEQVVESMRKVGYQQIEDKQDLAGHGRMALGKLLDVDV